jgi:hypothetical protein
MEPGTLSFTQSGLPLRDGAAVWAWETPREAGMPLRSRVAPR